MSEAARKPAKRDQLVVQAEIQALGKDLVSRFAMLLKTARLLSVQNQALQFRIRIFADSVNKLIVNLGEFTLRGDVDSVFVNDQRVRIETILWDSVLNLLSELAARGIGGVAFTGSVLPIQVRHVLQVLLDHPRGSPRGVDGLNELLAGHGLHNVRFLPRLNIVLDQSRRGRDVGAIESVHAFAHLLATWKGYLSTPEPVVPEIVRTRLLHAVQASVDSLYADADWFVAAASFRDAGEVRAVHGVCVTVLALAMGHRLDLGRKALMNLGMSALYADSGMRLLPTRFHTVPLTGGNARTPQIGLHPLLGVKEVLQTPALTRAQRDRILVAYEHHIGRDGSGYPPPLRGKGLHLFSSLVALADRYTELTTSLPGAPAMSPSRAVEVLAAEERRYDPRLLRIFLHLLGPFPIGTVVELTTGETAVVSRQHPEGRFRARPRVRIARDADGRAVRPAGCDLTVCDEAGNFRVGIVRAIDPGDSPVDPVQVLFFDARAAVAES